MIAIEGGSGRCPATNHRGWSDPFAHQLNMVTRSGLRLVFSFPAGRSARQRDVINRPPAADVVKARLCLAQFSPVNPQYRPPTIPPPLTLNH